MAHVIHFHSRADETADKAQGTCESSPTILRKAKRRTAYVIVAAILLLFVLVEIARAGGPQYVAGVTYFDPGLAGQPITWPNGTISYYTDLGSLSSILSAYTFSPFNSMATGVIQLNAQMLSSTQFRIGIADNR